MTYARVRAGFVSIDCGLPEQAGGYLDAATKLPYVPDDAFKPSSSKRYLNVRAFPGALRSCYTLPSTVARGSKYLLRATFMYGNYDGLSRLPVFDLHLGVNFWRTVNISRAETPVLAEAIAVIPDSRCRFPW